VKKSFSKNPRWQLKMKIFRAAILNHLRNLFSTKNATYNKKCRREIEKTLKTLQSYALKSDFNPPSWIDPPFSPNLSKYAFKSCCWSKHKFIAKDRSQKCWQIQNLCSFDFRSPSWTGDAILNLKKKTHFFYEICLIEIQTLKKKRKNVKENLKKVAMVGIQVFQSF
jgi:hypothetical protein